MKTSLATLTNCCLDTRLPMPDNGLSRLRSGVIDLMLATQPPVAMVPAMAANSTMAAKIAQAASPRLVYEVRRANMSAGCAMLCASK